MFTFSLCTGNNKVLYIELTKLILCIYNECTSIALELLIYCKRGFCLSLWHLVENIIMRLSFLFIKTY